MYTLFWLSEPQTDRPAGRVDTTPPYRLSRCRLPASPFLSCLGEVVCFCVPAVYRYFLRRRRRRQGGILRFLSPPSIPRNSSLSLTNHHQTSHPRCNTQSTPGMWVVRWTLPTPHSLGGVGVSLTWGDFIDVVIIGTNPLQLRCQHLFLLPVSSGILKSCPLATLTGCLPDQPSLSSVA